LDDCIIDLYFNGITNETLHLLYLLNKTSSIAVKTPFGKTEEFSANNLVKQGTIHGPVFCCSSLSSYPEFCNKHGMGIKINNIQIPPLSFVDDIISIHNNEIDAIKTNACAEVFQNRKRLLFNVKKCKTITMNTETDFNIQINNDNIEHVKSAKYLGHLISDSNGISPLIYEREKAGRSTFSELIATVEVIISSHSNLYIQALLKLFHTVLIPRIIHNCGVWGRITNNDLQKLNICVNSGLKRILKVPVSTPNCSIYLELKILPIKYHIMKSKLLYLKTVLSSDIQIIRDMLIIQCQLISQNKNCWLKDMFSNLYDLNLYHTLLEIKSITSSAWKTLIIEKINQKAFTELNDELRSKKKLQQLSYDYKTWQVQEYFSKYSSFISSIVFKTRTKMLPITDNYGSQSDCPKCKNSIDTQEHFFKCSEYSSPEIDDNLFYHMTTETNIHANHIIQRLEERNNKH